MTVEAGVPLASVQAPRPRHGHALPAVARLGRQLHDRRQPVDQRRRHRGAALRQRARARRSGSRSCLPTAACWHGLAGLRKDNTGYDLKQLFIGARRHARHHHRRGAEAVSRRRARARPRSPRCRRRGGGRAARRLKRRAGRPPRRLRAHERVVAGAVAQAPSPARPTRCPGTRGTRSCRPTTARRDAHAARRCSRRRSAAPSSSGSRRRRGRSRSREAQARRAVGAAREHQRGAAARRTEHQARHLGAGLGDSRVPGDARRARFERRCPACAS